MKYGIFEILDLVVKQDTDEKKIEVLRKYDCTPLRDVIRYAYDPNITWLLPEGPYDYKPSVEYGNEGYLYAETRRLYLFVDPNVNLDPNKRKNLFLNMLETVNKEDAKILLEAKDRNLSKLDYKLAYDAFPGLLPEHVEPKKKRVLSPEHKEALLNSRRNKPMSEDHKKRIGRSMIQKVKEKMVPNDADL
jgi:hypothetical protein